MGKLVMPRVAVVGYASVDHAMATEEFRGARGTTLIRERLSEPWPGIGGIAYAARGLAEAGLEVNAVTWVGADALGEEYTERLASFGVDTTGVVAAGDRTPSCYLFYGPEGDTVVVYDPGDRMPTGLTDAQREVLAGCDWVCLLVGPRSATVDVLRMLRPEQRLAWGVKGDPDAYTAALVHRLLFRVSVLTFSARERIFLERMLTPRTLRDRTPREALLVETNGTAGIRFWHGEQRGALSVTPIDAVDTTGAGDVLFAATVASMIEQPDGELAVRHGVDAATALLRSRLPATLRIRTE
ncbi:carbohydrate kinase family protein [Amycolatopsis cihanbeyliensis]|uniref:Ribokinase n=1 Tax=Amycolatopsis cihanbeyliensis TaxID=1128664 RepID=A0A542DCY3_AMYCI|nr:carbohydrate kinase family protein [Amycolatopsis cihanbeyliensis]TQJ00928.1 ribokinase [Amycolatopsis cihanbeyliensis]